MKLRSMKTPLFLDAHNKPHKKPKRAPITWRVSAYALIRRGDKILMVKGVETGRWELPGGGIDADETIAQGIERECYEETGYRVRVLKKQPLDTFEAFFYIKKYNKYYHVMGLIYEARLRHSKQNKGAINTIVPNEILDVQWLKIKDIKAGISKHVFTRFLKSLI